MKQDTSLDATSVGPFKSWLMDWLSREIGIDRERIDPGESFLSYGLDSVQAMTMVGDIEAKLSCRLPPTLAWDYPNIDVLTEHLADRIGTEAGMAAMAPRNGAVSDDSRAEVEGVLANIGAISDQDVDSLLARYLGTP